jgi:hypothetical protein
MDIPSIPAPSRGRPTWRGVRRPSLDMDAANLGSTSIPKQFTRHLYLPLTATLAFVARGSISDRYTHARRTELRCHGRGTGKSGLRGTCNSLPIVLLHQFMQDGNEEFLSQTVHITIAPVTNVDSSFSSTSRRPSLVESRRISDTMVPQTSPSR